MTDIAIPVPAAPPPATAPDLPIAFIGGGNMASAIIGGLIRQGLDAARIDVVEPFEEARARLAQQRVDRLPCAEPLALPPTVAVSFRVGEDVEEQPVAWPIAAAARLNLRARVRALQRVEAAVPARITPGRRAAVVAVAARPCRRVRPGRRRSCNSKSRSYA